MTVEVAIYIYFLHFGKAELDLPKLKYLSEHINLTRAVQMGCVDRFTCAVQIGRID